MNSLEDTSQKVSDLLLPTGSEDKEVRIGGGEYSCGNTSHFTCQDMKSIALKLHGGSTHAKKKSLYTECGHMGLGQYNSLGEYCGPHTCCPRRSLTHLLTHTCSATRKPLLSRQVPPV